MLALNAHRFPRLTARNAAEIFPDTRSHEIRQHGALICVEGAIPNVHWHQSQIRPAGRIASRHIYSI